MPPRTKRAEKSTLAAAEATPENAPAIMSGEAAGGTAAQEPPAKGAAAEKPTYADPHATAGISLSDHRGGPSMHLLRSHKFKQMQVRFDHGRPDEQYLKMLTDAGWTDRTQSEGIFTKQIDPNARWQSVEKMEQEFKRVANKIREAKGLGPALEIGE